MLLFKKTGLALLILLLAASGISAQHPLPFVDVDTAYRYLVPAHIKPDGTNDLAAQPDLFCIRGAALTDSIEVGVLVGNAGASHYRYYRSAQDARGYVQFPTHDTWVFAWADLLARWTRFSNPPSLQKGKRLSRILGLPDTADRDTIVILRVKNTDLFRPAYQIAVDQLVRADAATRFPISATPGTPIGRFLLEQKNTNTMPWTRMGYTYNWGSTDPNNYFGLAEFVFLRGTSVRYLGYELVGCLP